MKAHEVIKALRLRFTAPEYAFLTEVANATGAGGCRRADAVAMCMYPSRGLDLHGIEVKVSKSDLMRELAVPDKAESVAKNCHFWWIAAPKALVSPANLPTNWGLLECTEGAATIKKQAVRLDPVPLGYPFLAAMLRRATEQSVDKVALAAEYERGYTLGEEAATIVAKRDARVENAERVANALRDLRATVRRFEQQSGVQIDQYNGENIGNIVRAVLNAESLESRIREQAERTRMGLQSIEKLLAELTTEQPHA